MELVAYMNKIKQLIAGTFTLTFEGASGSSIPMLDLRVGRLGSFAATGRVGYEPYIKPSNRSIPLDRSSAHNACVHRWPYAYLLSLARNSSTRQAFLDARSVVLSRFALQFMDSTTLERLRQFNPYDSKYLPSRVACDFVCGNSATQVSSVCNFNLSLVIRHHPLLVSARISKVMERVLAEFHTPLLHLCGGSITPRIGWKNRAPALFARVRSCFRPSKGLEFQWV